MEIWALRRFSYSQSSILFVQMGLLMGHLDNGAERNTVKIPLHKTSTVCGVLYLFLFRLLAGMENTFW